MCPWSFGNQHHGICARSLNQILDTTSDFLSNRRVHKIGRKLDDRVKKDISSIEILKQEMRLFRALWKSLIA